jgi:hypothetical protein
MKSVNLAAQLAAAETELTCLKMALAQVKEDREELRQARDDWRREAAKLYAEKLIDAKLREADEAALRSPRTPPMVTTPRASRLTRTARAQW